ncbi:energy-coupling factor ABC transporter ATP-binding protein [Lactobacillus sp.] [Lactiplantibacillus mudanjiangensis]|uniref:Energy-coupling factor ABC transporter ATP-binding protein [Lactobacillus sp.] n=1 Tax=Lactiplantibacillus mudanjiangensis TaxID=1296538 RepID=A0A660E473_9LACO|nr:energy-coupling factor ABC transporter ATP-binding protein [Lactobacillus sp.] [Lactiplantibacillus mudanjiangensis]VDG23059.1 energy-coupling factor ABC transporter ATP-binding protein [Lactobacillus sp.] [Lactiplantibacillus mudanjiangensis]VDG29533.1 energy-coupling factor ABC transporter ATP-binding protein [Lactobacillus sp.] [Lactiplantibacillus mudanjiangensis]VDG32646.1 energy-coupling factor ABC transporter ATP-binding protein [Lactobacillus sp.] [Lactiplantibacillus mudanjiangensis]
MSQIINVEHLNYRYPQQDTDALTLTDVSFSVAAGEWVAIVGHNGSGKSTLAKNLNGLLAPVSGQITIDGQVLSEDTVWDIRRKIGMVFQNPDNQFVGATVADDVAFSLENQGIPRETMLKRVDEALAQVDMSAFKTREPARLSGGQKQRVALAGMIAARPKILILDEATSMLDPEGRAEVLATIRQMKADSDLTVLSITHDIDEAASANRVLVVNDGQLVEEGTPAEIFEHGPALIKMGLDMPYPERLKAALKRQGVTVPTTYLTEKGMADWLWQLISNK